LRSTTENLSLAAVICLDI